MDLSRRVSPGQTRACTALRSDKTECYHSQDPSIADCSTLRTGTFSEEPQTWGNTQWWRDRTLDAKINIPAIRRRDYE